jgi:hypothetical protein
MPVTVAFTAPRKPRLSVAAKTLKAFCQRRASVAHCGVPAPF